MEHKHSIRILSFVLAYITAICTLSFIMDGLHRAYASEQDENIASAVLTENFESHNFSKISPGQKKGVKYIVRGGTQSWYMDSSTKTDSAFIYFDLSDNFAKEINDGSTFELEFEYYSMDNGWFRVVYDSQRKSDKNGDIIYTGNSHSWEKATVTIDDAYFGNRLLGRYDFMLSIQAVVNNIGYSDGHVAIRHVKVTRHKAKNPVTNYCEIKESGNVFSDFQTDKIIYNNLKNTTDREQSFELRGYAQTARGNVELTNSQKITLAPHEERAVPLNIETNRCDLYNYYTEIFGDGYESSFKPQRFAIVKTDPDGIRNERYYENVHAERYTDTIPEMADVLKKMNCGGVRFTFGWKWVQWSASSPLAYTEKYKKTHQTFTDNGLNMLVCLNQFPGGVPDPWDIKNTDSIEQYKKALDLIVGSMPDTTLYEVWNEPMATFMIQGILHPDPDDFARVSALTVDYVHSLKPDAKVGVWSLCGMTQDQVFEKYYLPGMQSKYNIWENAEALAMHPYTRVPMERTNTKDEIIKKYLDEFYKRGREDIDVWLTEIGMNSYDSGVGNEENKAAYNARLFTYLSAWDLADVFAHYNFEQKGIIKTNRESQFGIVSCGDPSVADIYGHNYTATEAYVSAAAQNYLMAQITPNGDFCRDNVMAYRFKSEKFNKDIVSIWGLNYDEVKKVDLGTNTISYYDINGNETVLTSADGTYTFDITHQPFYLMGDIPKCEVLDDKPDFELSQKEFKVLPGDKTAVTINQNIEGDYNIEVDTPVYVSLDEMSGFKDGKAVLSFDITDGFEDNTYIGINIKDKNDRLVQRLEMRCAMTERAISSDVTSSLAGYENLNRWKVRITVKNESMTHLKRAKIKFNSPAGFDSTESVDAGPIPPQKTAAVEINCPEILEKGMYNLNYDVILDDGMSYNFSKAVSFVVTNKADADNPIVIDGKIGENEWDKSTAMYLNNIEQVVGYEDWGGKDDLSGYYIVSWDEENFYLCASVTDDVFYQDPDYKTAIKCLGQGDGIRFGIYHNIDTYIVSGQGNVDYHGIELALTKDGPKAYRIKSQSFNAIPVGEMTDVATVAISRSGNVVNYEFKCDWNTLLGYEYTPKVGDEISFAARIEENDGKGKRGYMQFAGGLGSPHNVELFSRMKYIDIH